MLLCAITNRRLEGSTFFTQRAALLARARLWAERGVDLIQLREKDLPEAELMSLAKEMRQVIQSAGTSTRLIVNAALHVALAAKADGVHLPSAAPFTRERLWASAACHTEEQVTLARNGKADCILFAPIFGKQLEAGDSLPGVGLEALAAACRVAAPVPVLALGGVTAQNAAVCVAAGASGIAAIRLFYGPPAQWEHLH